MRARGRNRMNRDAMGRPVAVVAEPNWPKAAEGSVVVVGGNEFVDQGPRQARHYPGGAAAEPPPDAFEEWAAMDECAAKRAIKARLRAMGETAGRLEYPRELLQLMAKVSGMPQVVRERYDYPDPDSRPKLRPTARQLSEMDEVLGWLLWLDPDTRTIVAAFGFGFSLRKTARYDRKGQSHMTIQKKLEAGIAEILGRLREQAPTG